MVVSLEEMRSGLRTAVAGTEPGLPTADELCRVCVTVLGVDGAAVSMVRDGTSWGTFGSSGDRSRRLDEHQFTFGEGPCLDAVAQREAVLVPDLDAPAERRWPAFAEAVLDDGIHGVFALPVMVTSECVGALDLFRERPGPLDGDQLAGALLAATMATTPLLDLLAATPRPERPGAPAPDPAADSAAGSTTDTAAYDAELERVEVYQATGMLIAHLDVSAEEALLRLRAHAIATRRTASQVARDIVERRLMLQRDDEPKGRDGSGRGDR